MRQLSRISLRDILFILFRDKNRILLITIVAMLGSYIYVIAQSSIYVAESKILVRIGKEKLSGIESYAKDNYNILFQERGQDIFNGIEILNSRQLAIKVADRMKPLIQPPAPPTGTMAIIKHTIRETVKTVKDWINEPLYLLGFKHRLSEDDKLLEVFSSALGVEAIEDTTIIKISFGWPNAEFAALAANTFADEFIQHYIFVHRNLNSESFYRQQSNAYEASLSQAEARLSDFRAATNISNIALEKEILLKSISETEANLIRVSLRLEENRALRNGIESALKRDNEWIQTPASSGSGSTDLSELDRNYLALVSQKVELSSTHTARSLEMQAIDREIESLRQQKAKNLTAYYSLNMLSIIEEHKFLQQQLEAKKERLSFLNLQTGQLEELERTRTIAEENFLNYIKKAEEMRVSDELDNQKISGIRVVNSAIPPSIPSYPRRSLIVSLAILFGLFLGIGFSAITEYFNQTFRNTEDVERILGIELLMTVPRA